MPSPQPSSLSNILAAVKAQLVFYLGNVQSPATAAVMPALQSNPSLIKVVGRRQTPRMQADQDILLRPGTISWNHGTDTAAGRVCPLISRPLLVHLRTRFGTDMSDTDDAKMTDPQHGHLAFEEAVVDCLLDFIPTDTQNNWLTQEPLHPIDYPEEEVQAEQAADWVETTLAFQLIYQPVLNASGANY